VAERVRDGPEGLTSALVDKDGVDVGVRDMLNESDPVVDIDVDAEPVAVCSGELEKADVDSDGVIDTD
jgi:hypothetical protein